MKHIVIALVLFFSLSVFSQQEFELTLSTKGLDLIEIGIAGFTGNGADTATMEDCRKLLSRDLQLTGVLPKSWLQEKFVMKRRGRFCSPAW